MELTISRALLDEMHGLAAASPDQEICGLLLGRGAVVEKVLACENIADDPRDSFEIDPVALIAVHRAARGGGAALIGHYHSHPNGSATPSARDAALAQQGSYWIIIARGDLRGWLAAAGGRFIPIEILFSPQ